MEPPARPRSKQTAEQRWACYWKNPEKVREKNRLYYWKKKGVDPPEWKRYNLRQVDGREEVRQQFYKTIEENKKELDEKEKALAEREAALKAYEEALKERLAEVKEQVKEIKKAPRPRPEPRPKKTPPAPVITAPVSFVVGKDAFA